MFQGTKNPVSQPDAIPIEVPSPPEKTSPIAVGLFLTKLKETFSQYRASQDEGFQIIINKFFALGYTDLRWLAYCLATAMWETAHTMKPVTEYGGTAYLESKPYWPFVGRGYVQLTWDFNYRKYGIVEQPQRALEPDFAAYILVDGMVNGTFTSRKLSDYFGILKNDPVNARRIVNGLDKAEMIAGYHNTMLKALQAAKV